MPTNEEIEAAARALFAIDVITEILNDGECMDWSHRPSQEELKAMHYWSSAQDALEAAEKMRPKHTDHYIPCPTCGFVVVKIEQKPFVYREDDDADE